MPHDVLRIGPKITALPVIHGSGDFALCVRRMMLEHEFDCLAVPLPPSFQQGVEAAVADLPRPALVAQEEPREFAVRDWSPDTDLMDAEDNPEPADEPRTISYVPIDPCQPLIAAIRIAQGEHIPRAFIDLETARFRPLAAVMPDPYAVKRVAPERFAAAVLPSLQRLPPGQPQDRVVHVAARLRELESRYNSILFVCSALDWPWVREAYVARAAATAEDDEVEATETFAVDPRTLIFLFGELPFITGLYERARAELDDDENLSIDGVKELLVAAREAYKSELKGRARKITPHLLATCLKYVRNLSLLERRMTPDLYSLIVAARQTAGDRYALTVAETAREYFPAEPRPSGIGHRIDRTGAIGSLPDGRGSAEVQLGIDRARLPDGDIVRAINRLAGPPVTWRSCDLQRRPEKQEVQRWRTRWNPFSQCSWPPEDRLIEDFRSHVFERAKAVMGADLVRTEKFTTSIKDGIDIRDTLRNWHTGEIYVKELPPSRGKLDCAVMLFDSPADPRDYPWRVTWYAEHEEESTLAFYATHFGQELIGPGIAQATYGGAMFLFPPVHFPDVWRDERLDFCETLEERLLAGACLHSRCPHVALVSPGAPGAGWRRLAKRFGKKWVHVPLAQFGASTIQQMRVFHVLNGRQVRSWAADFIRKA